MQDSYKFTFEVHVNEFTYSMNGICKGSRYVANIACFHDQAAIIKLYPLHAGFRVVIPPHCSISHKRYCKETCNYSKNTTHITESATGAQAKIYSLGQDDCSMVGIAYLFWVATKCEGGAATVICGMLWWFTPI